MVTNTLNVGDKVYFRGEVRPYVCQARSARYAICTKPFNPKRTVLYTILDFDTGCRASDDSVFKIYGYDTREKCEKNLTRLLDGTLGLSKRRVATIDIVRVVEASTK